MSEEMTIRKANHDRKIVDKKIAELSIDISRGSKAFIGLYKKDRPAIGTYSVEEFETEATATWQKLNDLIAYREQLNRAVMNGNATTMVTVPVFKNLVFSGEEETEQISLAAAIARKNYYKTVLLQLVVNIRNSSDRIERSFESTQKRLNDDLRNTINREFGAESNQSVKARLEYEEAIKPQFTLVASDPLKITKKLEVAAEAITDYIGNIDSIISNATETTMVTVED